jgi:DNA mismatch repair protein MutL
MEKRIKLLPEAVQHMISAGEVVEGPSSVIKELIENSIDAGAVHIVIDVIESGFSKITVRDDGSGIYKEDLPLSLAEHATSKIESFHDIQQVVSFGFRGEALSSIGSVSELTMLSRRKDEAIGGRLEVKNGVPALSDYAGPTGTTVIVENLFYNVPARKKFMKSASAESRAIRETVVRAALSAPHVSFNCIINDKKSLNIESAQSRGERISQIFGDDELDGLNESSISDISVKIHGFVSRPHFMKASRFEQYLFVNNRPVEMKHYSFLLSRAYDSAVPQGKYPAAFVFVEIKPDLVDVNIHPAKREIKFFDQRYVEGLIISLIKKTLDGAGQRFDLFAASVPDAPDVSEQMSQTPKISVEEKNLNDIPRYVSRDYSPQKYTDAVPETSANENAPVFKVRELQHYLSFGGNPGTEHIPHEFNYSVVGMLFGTYILAETEEELKILDFHAAHERINYDRLISAEGDVDSQSLVFPEIVKCARHRYETACELLPELNSKGFDIEPFSEDSFIVRAVPPLLGDSSVIEFVTDMFESFDGTNRAMMDDKAHHVAERIACHASRRRNDRLSREEMSALFSKIFSGGYALTCPHGRPYLYTVKRAEFEKMFRR